VFCSTAAKDEVEVAEEEADVAEEDKEGRECVALVGYGDNQIAVLELFQGTLGVRDNTKPPKIYCEAISKYSGVFDKDRPTLPGRQVSWSMDDVKFGECSTNQNEPKSQTHNESKPENEILVFVKKRRKN
jgi:hypothetical protein